MQRTKHQQPQEALSCSIRDPPSIQSEVVKEHVLDLGMAHNLRRAEERDMQLHR